MTRTHALRSISPLLQVRSLRNSIEFYVKTLGFTEEFREGDRFAIVCRDECSLFLAQKENAVDLRNRVARASDDGYAAYDLHFNCERGLIDELWREYREAGAPMTESSSSGPVNRSYGIRDFAVVDPDGYHLVFGSPLE